MDSEMRKRLNERSYRLAAKWVDIAIDDGYDLAEIAVAAEGIVESVECYAAMKIVFGDDFEKVMESKMRVEIEKAIKEAEEAINGD